MRVRFPPPPIRTSVDVSGLRRNSGDKLQAGWSLREFDFAIQQSNQSSPVSRTVHKMHESPRRDRFRPPGIDHEDPFLFGNSRKIRGQLWGQVDATKTSCPQHAQNINNEPE